VPKPTALTALALVALLLVAGGGVAAAPPPTPFCTVCGEPFHEDVTATDATLQVRESGDIHWRVENEVADPTASEWRESPEEVEALVAERLRTNRPPEDPSKPTVAVDGGTVTIEFVDRGAARQRLGLLVVPYFNGEGRVTNYVINADTVVVEAPEGHRIANDPAGATAEEGRAVWTGVAATDGDDERDVAWQAPEPGETYVVTGSGTTAGVRSAVVTTLEPLDPGLYGYYGVGLLFVVAAAYGVYRLEGTRLPRRSVAGGSALTAVRYEALVAAVHPAAAGGLGAFLVWLMLGGAGLLLAAVGGGVLYIRASVVDDRATTG